METIGFSSLIFWVLLSLVVGEFSRKKGGSFAAGFCFSLLLSPILAALIIALREPKNQKKCPRCMGNIPIGAKACMHCGCSFTGAAAAGGSRYRCPNCKAVFSSAAASDEVCCEKCMTVFSARSAKI